MGGGGNDPDFWARLWLGKIWEVSWPILVVVAIVVVFAVTLVVVM